MAEDRKQLALGQMANGDSHDFRCPISVNAPILSPLIADLIATPAFQRLDDICFLGGFDYRLVRQHNGSPVKRYTRHQHSLGVLKLAHEYCSLLHLSSSERDTVCTAALLHDIGHPPFSHSMEPVFVEYFDMDHHQATQDIIYGRINHDRIGSQVFQTLCSYNVDIDHVASLIAGQSSDFGQFFSGPITFDTIEGILRSLTFARRRICTTLHPGMVMKAAAIRAAGSERCVDELWHLKNEVYSNVVNSREGITADFVSQQILRQHIGQICEADYYCTEKEMFCKMPELNQHLKAGLLPSEWIDSPTSFLARRYFIDANGDFYKHEDDVRYRCVKQRCELPRHLMPLYSDDRQLCL